MSSKPEKYSCDLCRASKVTCSRESTTCRRCRDLKLVCLYSRQGVVRRRRKRKSAATSEEQSDLKSPHHDDFPSHLALDVESTEEQLRTIEPSRSSKPIDALQILSKASSGTGLGPRPLGMDGNGYGYHRFPDQAEAWTQAFHQSLTGKGSWTGEPPSDVLHELKEDRPHRVRDNAWLVMYYATAFNICTTASVKDKLRENIWQALSDVRVLLEPTDLNIRAILLVLREATEITTPTLCWMLATSACRMLQALDIGSSKVESAVSQSRRTVFWHLNLLDKSLAIIFRRSPTFHRRLVREIGLPTLIELQEQYGPGVFSAHHLYQKILLSHLMDEIWSCLYGDGSPADERLRVVCRDLDSWYEEAQQILKAAVLLEKPLVDETRGRSMELSLRTLEFHYLYLAVLLTRYTSSMRSRCLDSSERLLRLLPNLGLQFRGPQHPFLWQLVCCPFTPFLVLYRAIMTKDQSGASSRFLDAMSKLPIHLKLDSLQTPLAAKLIEVAAVLLQHAATLVSDQDSGEVGSSTTLAVSNASSSNTDVMSPLARPSTDQGIHDVVPAEESPDLPFVFEFGTFDLSFIDDFPGESGAFDWLDAAQQAGTFINPS